MTNQTEKAEGQVSADAQADLVKNVTIDLKFPVEHDGREYKQLQMRRMRAGDTLIAENETSKAKSGFVLFATLAGVDIKVIEKLDMLDLMELGQGLESLMGKQLVSKAKLEMGMPSIGETK